MFEVSTMAGYVRWEIGTNGRVNRSCYLMNMYCQELDPMTTDDAGMAHILVPFVKSVVQELKEASTYRDISMFLNNLPTHLIHAQKYTTELTDFANTYFASKIA
jgi:hypothetical protein